MLPSGRDTSQAHEQARSKLNRQLLIGRPQQQTIEDLSSEQWSATKSGRPTPYLISRCRASTIDPSEAGQIAKLTIEHSSELKLRLCPVITATDMVHSKSINLVLIGDRSGSSSITIDACQKISITVETAAQQGLVLYTSASSDVVLDNGQGDKHTILADDGHKVKTCWSDETGGWSSAGVDHFGDI